MDVQTFFYNNRLGQLSGVNHSVSRRRRLEFPTTFIEEIAMAASAKTG